MQEIRIPNIGDVDEVYVIELCAAPGDTVDAEDVLIVIESDKASMEVPAGVTGVVQELLVAIDDPVAEGQSIACIKPTEAAESKDQPAAVDAQDELGKAPAKPASRPSGAAAPTPDGPPIGKAAERKQAPTEAAPAAQHHASSTSEAKSPAGRVYAGPATRRLARELGVQLAKVAATGARGRIIKDDVKCYVKERLTSTGGGLLGLPAIDFTKFGRVELMPLSRIRAAGAQNLHRSWLNLPHVTQHDDVDVDALESFRASLKAEAANRKLPLSPLPFLIKACCQALKAFPTFNASLDGEAANFVLKHYYNIGIAVDTKQGLVVPVIKNADGKGIRALAAEVSQLADQARNQKLAMGDMQGGTFSLSSLGAIGGTGFTPIINAPEVAILGIGRLTTKPIWDGAAFQPRKMLPLSLSYDHRAINGAEAGRFIAYLAELLGDPRRLSL